MRLPAKLSSFGGVFRYDEPQKGRYRYFHQWDIEIYGRPSLESESEIIEMTSRLFDSLLLKGIIIDINHRGLVESYINKIFESRGSKTCCRHFARSRQDVKKVARRHPNRV